MRKWVRIEKGNDGYHVLTGVEDRPGTSWFIKSLTDVLPLLRDYFGEPTPIEIFVQDGIVMKEKVG